jgi:hypothetical protein
LARRVYRLASDVRGEAYKLLLEAALEEASTFSLVWRDELDFAPSARAMQETLRELQLRHVKRDRWPGTVLIGHYASVFTYRATPEALPTLLEPGSLFGWRAPRYPEDLSFSNDAGTVSLATVAHEAEGWIFSPLLATAIERHLRLLPETLDERHEQYFESP